MEDAATAEISRAQLWQWVHHKAKLRMAGVVTVDLVESIIENELAQQRKLPTQHAMVPMRKLPISCAI